LTANPDGSFSPGYQAPMAPPNVDDRSPFADNAPGGNIMGAAPSAIPADSPSMAKGGVLDAYHVHGLPDATSGGHVPYGISPSHGHVTDDVVANLNAGEFVFPRDVTQHYGHKALYGMINKARKEAHDQHGQARAGHSQPAGKSDSKPSSDGQNFNMGGAI
jgi:hypothetical protein